jgi:ribonuclease-3
MTDDADSFARILGHRFRQPHLLRDALTHSSSLQGRGGRGARVATYERLEFLGDRVLGLVVADMLLKTFPRENEGQLARRHAALVRREALARVAAEIGLGEHLTVSRGEEESGGRENPTLLADACEAVIGALYADAGLDPAYTFVRRHWESLMAEAASPPKDAKTALQEWAQGRGKALPVYRTLGMEGPSHEPNFLVEVAIEGHPPMTGRASSKREAQQAAARAMLEAVKA